MNGGQFVLLKRMIVESVVQPHRVSRMHVGTDSCFLALGSTNQQLAGFFQDIVMEQAMTDRVSEFARIDTPDVSFRIN